MSKSEGEDLPKSLLIRYGPYIWSGIVQHRLQRLHGLILRLEELGYRLVVQPHDIWDHLDILYEHVKIFRCRLTLLKYNCTWERDVLCQKAVAAVETMVPQIEEALLIKSPPVDKKAFEVYPPISVLYEIFYGVKLPAGPATKILEILLDNVCSTDQNKIDFMNMLDEMFMEHRITYRICMRIKAIVFKLPLEWFREKELLDRMRNCIISLTNEKAFSMSLTDISETIFQMFISNLTRFLAITNSVDL